jgi:predicted deacetylase
MQMMPQKGSPRVQGLVVSIHDVSPRTRDATEAMLADLADLDVRRVSLLVIPDHHHRGHFLDDPDFCAWLRDCAAAGHEIVAHGYYHIRESKADQSLASRLVTERYTAGEGEFYDLDEAEAHARVTKAREEFRRAGLEPTGFIAPAWLLGDEATRAVRRAGFQYTTRLGSVEDLANDIAYDSQSLVYSVRAAWRRVVSLAWNSFLLRRLGDLPLVRMGLHPPDWQYPAIRDHARKCLLRALVGREAITYEDWLGRQRALSTP